MGEIKKWEQNDQINKLRSKLLKLGKLNTSLINKIEIQIRKEILSAFNLPDQANIHQKTYYISIFIFNYENKRIIFS